MKLAEARRIRWRQTRKKTTNGTRLLASRISWRRRQQKLNK